MIRRLGRKVYANWRHYVRKWDSGLGMLYQWLDWTQSL
jgi:hypothetical protein